MSATELLPCPFCGGAAEWQHNDGAISMDSDAGGHWVNCGTCGASTNMRFNLIGDCRPLLAEQWNRRTPLASHAGAEPVAWWIPEAEQFCMNTPEGRPFAKHWEPLYAAPGAAIARVQAESADWSIDHSAGRPILTYKKCSVIEAEDAEYVLRLIAADRATPPAAIPLVDHEQANVSDNESCGSSVSDKQAAAIPAAPSSIPEKVAPVQGCPGGIPWSLHLEAYAVYCKKWSPQPALIDLEGRNCRGGFHVNELDEFIPGWRDRLRALKTAPTAAPGDAG